MSTDRGLRDDIQGLRGIAVLLVVLYHAGLPATPGGFVGVDIFFVISGFVITSLLLREWRRSGRIDLITFYARRARRLLPASLVLIAFVIVVLPWLLSPLERRDIVSAGRAASIYVANFWFAGRAVDYLAGGSHGNPFLHMWSLAIEEQFYLFWPLMLLGLCWLARRMQRPHAIAMAIGVICIASLGACLWMTASDQPWAFFGMPFRAWEFGLGALALLVVPSATSRSASRLAAGLGWAGAALVVASALGISESLPFPGPWAVPPALGTALLLWSTQSGHRPLSAALSWAPLARLGDLSYSWYLWHWPLLVYATLRWPEAGVWSRVLAVSAGLIAAMLSLHLVENPIRFGGRQVKRNGAWLAAAGASTVAAALLLTWTLADIDRTLKRAPDSLFVAATLDRAGPSDLRCQADFDTVDLRPCVFGALDSAVTVVLAGDSHASHWFPAMERLATQHHWKLVSLSKTACPLLDAPVPLAKRQRAYPECAVWREHVLLRIEALKPSLIVVANHGGGYDIGGAAWESGLSRTLPRLVRTGAAVAVIHDIPWPDYSVPECLVRADWQGEDPARRCSFAAKDAQLRNLESLDAERRAIASSPGAFAIDPTRAFCDANTCASWSDGVVRYTDAHHMTAAFSLSLAPFLEAALRQHAEGTPNMAALFADIRGISAPAPAGR